MADKTLYFVQPYVVKRQKLVASGALTFMRDGEALAAGARLARHRAGIVVLSQAYDVARHEMCKPTVMRIHGSVPSEWQAQTKAA